MYAIFQIGSKQHLASEGEIIRLEKLNIEVGKIVEFTKILVISNYKETMIGMPFIKNKKIKAKVISHNRNKKIKVIKFRRRKHYRRKIGHRQWFTNIRIISIDNQ